MGHLGTPGADEARPHNQGNKDKTTKTREHKITTLYFRLSLHSHGIGGSRSQACQCLRTGPLAPAATLTELPSW